MTEGTGQKIEELDVVALVRDHEGEGLAAGDIGTVVIVYADGEAYEVEFISLTGETIALLTLEAGEVRPVKPREIAHVREVA